MALLENIQNLPKPVLYAGAGGAALGLLSLIYRKGQEKSAVQRPQVAGPGTTPVYLPPGAVAGGYPAAAPYPAPGTRPDPVPQPPPSVGEWGGQGSFPFPQAPPGVPGVGGGTGSTNTPGNSAVPDPPAAPAPAAPVSSPVPVANNPIAPAPAGNTSPLGFGMTKFIGDLLAGIPDINKESGSTADKIMAWLSRTKYKPFASYDGHNWNSFGRMEAGWTDANTGLVLPVAYNGTHDNGVGDYTNESYAARWERKTIGIMQANPGISQGEAGMAALANIRRDMDATGVNYYESGFDMAGVPSDYGRGRYWN